MSRSLQTMPELVDIINFETSSGENIKILEQIGTHYSDFGILLLQDKNGAVVQSIIEEANNKAVKINRDILTKWLEGTGKQPITWATLIGVLKDINLRVLAKKLEDNLTIPGGYLSQAANHGIALSETIVSSDEAENLTGHHNYHWSHWGNLRNRCGGSKFCIAIIDSGIYKEHAVFQKEGKIHPKSKNFCGDVNDLDDNTGHGTKCAAIAAGIEIDGFCGVAYDASLLICKVKSNLHQKIEALKYIEAITDEDTHVHVVSMSFGCIDDPHEFELKDCINRLTAKGVICVAAAGNYGNNPKTVCYPAKYDNVIAVGAHDSDGYRAPFSPDHDDVNYTTLGVGVCVPSKSWSKSSLASSNGTSMATPAVAGLIACILERHNDLEGINKKKRIKEIKRHLTSLTQAGDKEKCLRPHQMFY